MAGEFDEFGDPLQYSDYDAQCYDCYRFDRGPHKGQNPGYKVAHIDENDRMYSVPEARAEGKPFTMSHGLCKDCAQKTIDTWRNSGDVGKLKGMVEAEKERLRQAKKEVPDEPAS